LELIAWSSAKRKIGQDGTMIPGFEKTSIVGRGKEVEVEVRE
jgi:hypothetical protein